MIKLSHGCRCSEPKVFPSTWERTNASLKKPWYIFYRFYDPLFIDRYPTGRLIKLTAFNSYKTVPERQDACRTLLAHEMHMLRERDWNPITGTAKDPEEHSYVVHPETGLIKALRKALEISHMQENSRADIRSTLKFITTAAEQLRFAEMPVKDIRRRHIKLILEQSGKNKEVFTAATFNRYRRNLSVLFGELLELEAVELNPVSTVTKMKATRKLKVLLSDEERIRIDAHLRQRNYSFWRFMNIFFHSGARTTEIMKVRKQDVDIRRQMVKYTIAKGKVVREVERPIKDSILNLWAEIVSVAGEEDYLFSEGLNPGAREIRHDQVKRRWAYWVQSDKTGLGIKATWYSLKHLNTDQMSATYGTSIAARLNEHDESMVNKHYAVNHLSRQHEQIRKAENSFLPHISTGVG